MASPDDYQSLLSRAQITQPPPYHHRRGHHRHQHNQFLPHAPPAPPPAPPDQDDIHFFNHLADMHPPCPYSPPSLTGLSEADLSDTLVMEFLSTPIDDFFDDDFFNDDFFDSSLPSELGSGIDISRCDGNNAIHDGDISNEVKMPKSKVPRGLLLFRDEVYDIDGRPDGELPPQLEVRPIAKYVSDPGLVLGRQIAVNRSYICYGLKMGNIRVLNISSALRSLLRGHTQRITDMAFFADDVHILASASSDGRVFVWKINEGLDEEEKAQISGNILTAIQIIGEEETVYPRLCWHPHKQEILMVAIGNRIFKVDTTKVGKGKSFSAEEPLKCPANKLLKGVQIIGKHDAVITDLSMCSWMARLASASTDGMVKIWEEPSSVIVLQPYDGRPVNSVTFFTAPHRPDHIVLFTGGPLNREIKIWTSTSEDGRLLPSDSESWQCTQSLELMSSSEESVEHEFFIQIVAVPPAGVLLLANSKKNALYALHIDCGHCPESTYMASIAEFTVTMPILSLTGTSQSLPDGGHIVQIYCVQEQAIQQYALAKSQCPPPIFDNRELEKAQHFDSLNDQIFGNFESALRMKPDIISCSPTLVPPICPGTVCSVPATVHTVHVPSSEVTGFPGATAVLETKLSGLSSPVTAEQISSCSSPPLSLRLSQKSSGFRSPLSCLESNTTVTNHKIDHEMSSKMAIMKGDLAQGHSPSDDMCKNNHIVSPNYLPAVPDPPTIFKQPTHLITPSEILSKAPSSTETQISQTTVMVEPKACDVINNETDSWEVEVKVVGEAATNQNHVYDLKKGGRNVMTEHREEFYSQASDVSIHVARDYGVHSCRVEVAHLANDVVNGEERDQLPSNSDEVAGHFTNNDFPMLGETENSAAPPQSATPPAEVMGQKGTASQPSGPSSQSQSQFNSTDSSNDSGGCSGTSSGDATCCQLSAMQEMLDQLVCMQKEMQKQMTTIVSVPFNQEGRRLEASLGRNMENAVKAYEDSSWDRFLEENAKHDKLEQERTRQITSLINNCLNRDFPSIPEKAIKQKLASVGPVGVRAVTPIIEKSASSAIAESFQKGVGDKPFNQLEKGVSSKLEAVVARQIQSQFQTSGKQALQDSLRASLETSLIPAFELPCKAMFKQVDVTVQNGLMKHITTMQQQFESAHSPLTIALRDALNSASSLSQMLCGELADGQRTLMAIATAGAGSKGVNTSVTQLSSGPLAGLHEFVEAPIDPTKELSRLLAENQCEEAFTAALHKSDASIVSWLCSQVDSQEILSVNPLPLSQGVLLALLQQLAWDIGEETSKKIGWMTDIAVVINPLDPMITVHVRPICEQVYQILNHQRSLPTVTASDAGSIRLLMHVINSVLTSCK